MPVSVTDETLMRQVRGGDEHALEALIRRHATDLLSYLSRIHPDRGRAEDVFQEVWLTVWVKRRSFDAARPFKPWLYRIARNRAVSAWRSSPSRRRASDPVRSFAASPDPAFDRVFSGEAVSAARDAIDRLPSSQRDVVRLRLYAGLGYAEIASVLAIAESTVRSNMCLALRRLRSTLSSWVESSGHQESRHDQLRSRG